MSEPTSPQTLEELRDRLVPNDKELTDLAERAVVSSPIDETVEEWAKRMGRIMVQLKFEGSVK